MKQKLRFAPLIRVSGEEQARLGESLDTQRKQIEEAVKSLGGVIPPKLATRYSGQEHATPGYERKKFDQLLADAASGQFDAIMVADISRWSRDNEKSQQGLKVLRKHGIRFFVLTTEHDLTNPEAELALGMFSMMNHYLARTQVKKAVDNRLARIRRGCPACGAIPFGRTFDKNTETWGVDEEKKKLIQRIAKRYIKGESLRAIARENRMNAICLWRILLKRSGPEFVVVFNKLQLDEDDRKRRRHQGKKVDDLVEKNRKKAKRIHDRVREIELEDKYIFMIDVPSLLDEAILARVRETSKKNQKLRGPRKHKYLLGGYLYCSECGKSMTGQSQDKSNKSYRYYRHINPQNVTLNTCSQKGVFVDADVIEDAVLLHLFATLGNASKIQKAIEAGNPDMKEQEEAVKEIEIKLIELKKIEVSKERLVAAVAGGHIQGEAIAKKMQVLEEEEYAIKDRVESLNTKIEGAPTPEMIKNIAGRLARGGTARRRAAIRGAMTPEEYERMSWKEKRELVELFFAESNGNAVPFGVYISRDPNYRLRGRKNRKWQYEIRGRFALDRERIEIPLSDKDRRILLSEVEEGTAAANLRKIYTSFNPMCAGCK